MTLLKVVLTFSTLILVLVVFRAWFSSRLLVAVDWKFFYPQNLRERLPIPLLWDNDGLGRFNIYRWTIPYFNLLAYFLASLGFSWPIIEKVIWPWPFLGLTIFSSWYSAKIFFPKSKIIQFFVLFIYLFNTYILMVVGGGQMGIAMAYSLAPLVFGIFAKSIQSSEVKLKIIAGLVLAFQIMFDPRVSLITMGTVFLYAIFQCGLVIRKYLKTFVLPFFIVLGLHFYWILPLLLVRRAALPTGYGEAGWVEFLSFADFSNSLSFLHPNWPENIFGKTYFMRPEFLALPILAYISLFLVSSIKYQVSSKKDILFFASLGLLGAFLAKGVKAPFGEVYLWLFKYFPGMNLFRDPTKFYLLVALSYSILIPFSLEKLIEKEKKILRTSYFVLFIFLVLWLLLIRPAWLGQLSGTFKAREVPSEYVALKDFIHNQDEFFRTFWIPKRQRFGFFSNNHPAVEGSELPPEEELTLMGVKYVIIPFDSESEIFLKDRQYDPQQRLDLEEKLDKVSWLKKIDLPCFNDLNHCNKIAIYQTPDYKDHFFVTDGEAPSIEWMMVNPTKYKVRVEKANQPFTLVFSETYDELWQAKIEEKIIPSKLGYNNLNSFAIDQTGDFEILVEFAAQKYVYWGLVVSGMTLLVCIWYLVSSVL